MNNSLLSIQNIGSEGFEIELIVEEGRIVDALGVEGIINKWGYISPQQKNYFRETSEKQRITQPMKRVDDCRYIPISFEEAFSEIAQRITSVNHDENLFLVSSTLTNEELYSAQKLARKGAKTNQINSIQYWNKPHLQSITDCNVALCELTETNHIYIYNANASDISDGINNLINIAQNTNETKVREIINDYDGREFLLLNKAIIDYQLYDNSIVSNIKNLDNLKHRLSLIEEMSEEEAIRRVKIASNRKAIYIFKEDPANIPIINEAINFLMLSGMLGQLYTGILVIRTECNSEGIFDMGCIPTLGVGRQQLNTTIDSNKMMTDGEIKNVFIFDNMDKPINEINLKQTEFIVRQSAFIDPNCEANLIMPASFHYEIGGTFTNTCHNIQKFNPALNSTLQYNSLEQYSNIMHLLGVEHPQTNIDIFFEIISLLKKECCQRPFDGLINN